MTQRTTNKMVKREAKFMGMNIEELVSALGISTKKNMELHHDGYGWYIMCNGKKLGHTLTTSQMHSMLFGFNQVIEEINTVATMDTSEENVEAIIKACYSYIGTHRKR